MQLPRFYNFNVHYRTIKVLSLEQFYEQQLWYLMILTLNIKKTFNRNSFQCISNLNRYSFLILNKPIYFKYFQAKDIVKNFFVDVNECLTNSHDCHSDADCMNKIGSYNCTCRSGYVGNGTICTGIKVFDVKISPSLLLKFLIIVIFFS